MKDFIQAPRSIVFARNLNSNCKIVLLELIDRYNYLNSKKKLPPDGSFYLVGEELERHTDLKKQHILRNIIPILEACGLISKTRKPKDKTGVLKTYCFYKLNWDLINNWDGEKEIAVPAKNMARQAAESQQKPVIQQSPTDTGKDFWETLVREEPDEDRECKAIIKEMGISSRWL